MSVRFHSLLSLGKHACLLNASKLGESLHRLLNNPDAEAVHDVRVACRRLGVALRIVEPLYQRRNLKPLAKKVKALMKALSAVRDTEVLSERARELANTAKKNTTPAKIIRATKVYAALEGAAHLADLLDAQVELGRLAGAATASHAGFLHLPQQIHTAMQALGLDRQKLHSFPLIRLPQFASEILWARLDDIMNMNITQASSSEDLHTLRIQFKKLRYAAEFFIEGLPAQRIQPLVKLAQQYQKILGDLHDADVALDMFRAWHAVRHEKAPGESLQTASGEQTVYEKLQAGLGKLMLAARNDQTRLRAKFFSLWTVRHQRALTKLVQEAGLPLAAAKRGAPRGGVRTQARQKS